MLIPGETGLDFDALLQRIHPADSRVRKLADETPASFVAFDLLAIGDRDLTEMPLSERRATLEQVATTRPPIFVTPISTDIATAKDWFSRFEGAGLDGVVAKRAELPYRPNERVMVKVKHRRTADCVVGGYRVHKDGNGVGSLLLGLYDDSGDLQHVGVASSFTAKRRKELLEELAPLRENALEGHPWQGLGRGSRARGGRGSAHARRREPLEREEGPVVDGDPRRARVRGAVRPAAAEPLPPRHVVRAVASRPRAELVHVRPARGGGAARAAERVRRIRSRELAPSPSSSCSI